MRSIFGLVHPEPDTQREVAARMFYALSIRDGNAMRTHQENDFLFGVRGTSQEVQSAVEVNRDRTVVVALEGEIYNYSELRRLLGAECAGELSDLGILSALYEKFGRDFARHLNGIFGIALLDVRGRTLYLIRDHLGSHSLFYGKRNGCVVFASCIHAVLASGLVSRGFSADGMHRYFSSTTIPAPDTLLTDIACVRAGVK